MKICQISAVDFTIKHFLLPLIDKMNHEKWDVTVICSEGKYTKSLKEKGYKIKNIQIPRNLNIYLLVKSFINLYLEFKINNYDIVHVHTPVASVVVRMAAWFARVPTVIYTAHGFYFHENMSIFKYYFYFLIEKFFGKLTDILFVQSNEDYETAKKSKFIDKNKLFAIGNGVDIKKFYPRNYKEILHLKKKFKLPEKSFVIGCIARLVEEKGIIEFLNAADKITNKFSNVYILLVGERLKTDHNKEISSIIKSKKNKMKEKLMLLGYRTDIPELISVMDLFCLPSWREGMSRSILEAMMMGKPILTTNIRGCREQVEHNKTGLIVPVKSELKIYQSIEFLINNKNIRKMYGKNSRCKALKNYNEKKILSFQIKKIKEHKNHLLTK